MLIAVRVLVALVMLMVMAGTGVVRRMIRRVTVGVGVAVTMRALSRRRPRRLSHLAALTASFTGSATASCTSNLVADRPQRSTVRALMSKPDTARLPSARFSSSNGRPASRQAPSTMSPEIPEKQSRYSTRDIRAGPSP